MLRIGVLSAKNGGRRPPMLSPQAGRGEDRDRCAIIELPNQPQPALTLGNCSKFSRLRSNSNRSPLTFDRRSEDRCAREELLRELIWRARAQAGTARPTGNG